MAVVNAGPYRRDAQVCWAVVQIVTLHLIAGDMFNFIFDDKTFPYVSHYRHTIYEQRLVTQCGRIIGSALARDGAFNRPASPTTPHDLRQLLGRHRKQRPPLTCLGCIANLDKENFSYALYERWQGRTT